MGDISGKVAIVTGASRGIGRGIALAFGHAGAKVVVSSRSQAKIDPVVDEIKRDGGTAIGITCDVASRDQVFGLIERAVAAFGPINILVNNAQSYGTARKPLGVIDMQPIETYDEEQWDYIFRTGLLSTLWGMKAVFPYMKDKGGKIINMCSLAGFNGVAGMAAYGAAKEGVRSLTRTAAREWGKYQINVNVVSPHVRSDSMDGFEKTPEGKNALDHILATIPLGRHGDAVKDAGSLAIFLASSDSDYITGSTFMLDGGLLMTP
jgi:NAD(P)-dependent dehydrogenase (short-subunit alcohol dehydrogenase family)